MFKLVVICALLASVLAEHHGHGHGHGHGKAQGRASGQTHGIGQGQGHAHGHVHGHDHGHASANGNGHGLDHHSGGSSSDDAHAEVKEINADVHEHGFHYNFETTNHIKASAEGDEHGNVHGDFQWISPEGEHIEVNYVADENGYQPKGDVLPTPPPIPESVIKALKYIESHPHEPELDEGHRY